MSISNTQKGRWTATAWTTTLADRYFSPAFAGEPVTLCTDADELASVRGLPAADAIEDLSSVVRREVMPNHRYSPLWMRCQRWHADGSNGPPPSLPLLALNVLAACRNNISRTGAANFYGPYRELLDPELTMNRDCLATTTNSYHTCGNSFPGG